MDAGTVSIVSAMAAPMTTHRELDQATQDLAGRAGEWAALPIPSKMALLAGLRERTGRAADAWVAAATEAKGIPTDSPLAGEEWLSGPYSVIAYVSALHQSLDRIWRGETTYAKGAVTKGRDGRAVVRVLPSEWHDRLLLNGYSAEVWMEQGVTPGALAANTASFYRESEPPGRVCLVLGAGNIAAIPPLDTLHKLYVDGEVVILKMNPVNDYLGPILEEVFVDFVERGYLRFATGGAEVGSYLTSHPAVDTVHITGSANTHDLIVFGAGEDGAQRKADNQPLLDKPITSELGGVTPVIVVPGPWTEQDLQFQAEHFVTQKLHNSGFNCVAAQVLVVPDGWEHTDRFLEFVEAGITNAPDRPLYYPGGHDRHDRARDRHDATVQLGAATPRAHLRNVPYDSDSFAFREEFFSSVFATTRLPNGDVASYLGAAVDFANNRLHGTLGASVLIHPATVKELGVAFENAIADLRYGCIGVNVWSGMGFLLARASWGAFPGEPLNDVGSGRGAVHNAFMFDKPEKTVVTGPFRPFHRAWRGGEFHLAPKPLWFVTHRTGADTARSLTAFAADGSLKHLPSILGAALRG